MLSWSGRLAAFFGKNAKRSDFMREKLGRNVSLFQLYFGVGVHLTNVQIIGKMVKDIRF